MHAVEAAHHVAVDHVDHRFGHGVVNALVGQHAFLDDDLALGHCRRRRLATRLLPQRIEVAHVAHRHDAHAVRALVGLDDDKRLFVNAVFLVLAADLDQQRIDVVAQAFAAARLVDVDLAAAGEHGVDQPRVDTEQLAKALAHFFVAAEVAALAPHAPAGLQRRQQVLLVQLFQNARRAGRQIVVEQDGAGVEVLQAEPVAHALGRLQRHLFAVGQRDGLAALDGRVDRAKAHVEPRHAKDFLQPRQAGQVKAAVLAVLRHDEQVARLGADFFNRRLRRLHGQRQRVGRQVVPAVGVQVGVDRCQLEAGISNVDRGVQRRRVLHPLEAKPAFDDRRGIEDALLQLVDRAGERCNQVGNHACGALSIGR